MRFRAEFPFVDKTVSVIVEMSDEGEQERSDLVTWEYPLCKIQLVRRAQRFDVSGVSLTELLSFLHLPLRRNEWPQLPEAELGDSVLSLRVGSFSREDGSGPHQMQLGHEGGGFEIEFSEQQAEQWAVTIWEIRNRLNVFL